MERESKILVIDDDDHLRNTLGLVLKRSGYAVVGAENADAALCCLEKETFDMAFLDLRMPGMDGSTLLVILREKYPDMPVIILTAYASAESSQHAAAHGARDYLIKPISPANLLARVKEYLNEPPEEQGIKSYHAHDYLKANLKSGSNGGAKEMRYIQIGEFLLDRHMKTVSVRNQLIELSTNNVEYLSVLMNRYPANVSYEELVWEAQGLQLPPAEAKDIARWHIQGLREALSEDARRASRIISIWNYGYRFAPMPDEVLETDQVPVL